MKLTNKELLNINGGALSATMMNALSRAATTLLKIGQTIGSSIRRFITGSYC